MQRTAASVHVRVGDEKTPITLTDSAVEALQGEAAGKAIDAFAGIWGVEKTIESGEGFAALDLSALLELRGHLQTALEMVDVLIECRPLDELDTDAED
jgi:hypothetical protein